MNRSVLSPQKLIHDKKYDSILRPLARQKKNPEEALDADQIGEDWKKIVAMRDNEIVEAEVKAKGEEKSGETEVESGLEAMRRAPADFTEGSEAYWMALANASARRVVTFAVLPKSQTAVHRVVAQSALKDVELTEGDHQFLE